MTWWIAGIAAYLTIGALILGLFTTPEDKGVGLLWPSVCLFAWPLLIPFVIGQALQQWAKKP